MKSSLIEQLKQSKDTHKWLLDRINEIDKHDILDYLYNAKLLVQAVEEKWEEEKKKYNFLWWGEKREGGLMVSAALPNPFQINDLRVAPRRRFVTHSKSTTYA